MKVKLDYEKIKKIVNFEGVDRKVLKESNNILDKLKKIEDQNGYLTGTSGIIFFREHETSNGYLFDMANIKEVIEE